MRSPVPHNRLWPILLIVAMLSPQAHCRAAQVGRPLDTPLSRINSGPAPKMLPATTQQADILIDGTIPPVFGIDPQKPFKSPTKVAANGTRALSVGQVPMARACFKWIQNNTLKTVPGQSAKLVFFDVRYAPKFPYSLDPPWTSGLAQGMALELAVQLHAITGEDQYLQAAKELFEGYLVPVEEGGFTRFLPDGVVFEEYPVKEYLIGVFNGGAVAALALKGYADLTGDRRALDLFDRHIRWLEQHVAELEAPEEGTGLTRYSFAKRRSEVLFRFTNVQGSPAVHRLALSCNEGIIASIRVGADDDRDVLNPGRVWYDPNYQSWGERTASAGRPARAINGYPNCRYHHAPFSFALSQRNDAVDLIIDLAVSKGDSFDVQYFHNKGYHLLQRITCDSDGDRRVTLPLSRSMLLELPAETLLPEAIEHKYLDDNQELLKALADCSSSKILARYARRWDRDWVAHLADTEGGIWVNKDSRKSQFPLHPIRSLLAFPPESLAAGWSSPNLVDLGQVRHLYYIEHGRGGSSGFCRLATNKSADDAWTQVGRVGLQLQDKEIITGLSVLSGQGLPKSAPLRLVYSVEQQQTHERQVCFADSADGWRFSNPRRVVPGAQWLAHDFYYDAPSGLWHAFALTSPTPEAVALSAWICDDLSSVTRITEIDSFVGKGAAGVGDVSVVQSDGDTLLLAFGVGTKYRFHYYDLRKKMSAFAGEVYLPAEGVQPIISVPRLRLGRLLAFVTRGSAKYPIPAGIWACELDQKALAPRLLSREQAFRVSSPWTYGEHP